MLLKNLLIEIHEIEKPYFLQSQIPVMSQLNVEVWQELLKDYWDQRDFPEFVHVSFASLFKLLNGLGLTISDIKLVTRNTKVVCLGVLINTLDRTVSIPPEKFCPINDTVHQWLKKETFTNH